MEMVMTDITPLRGSSLPAIQQYSRTATPAATANGTSRPDDQAELSDVSRLLSKLQDLPEIREDLVSRVRAELDAGTYETDAKIDAAIDAMLEDLA